MERHCHASSAQIYVNSFGIYTLGLQIKSGGKSLVMNTEDEIARGFYIAIVMDERPLTRQRDWWTKFDSSNDVAVVSLNIHI